MSNAWVLRAEGGSLAEAFFEGGFVAIDWLPDEPLTTYATRAELRTALDAVYVYPTETALGLATGQVWRFAHELELGDLIITPKGDPRWLFVGEVQKDGYRFAPSVGPGDFVHHLPVAWLHRPIDRRELPAEVLKSMRSHLTLFRVKDQAALRGFLAEIDVLN